MGGSNSTMNVLLMTSLVLGWGDLLDLLEYDFPAVQRLLRDAPTLWIAALPP